MFKVRVPATSANLGPGFDTLGLALDLFLEIEVEWASESIKINVIDKEQQISLNPNDNLIVQAMTKVFELAGINNPTFTLTINNNIPIGKGLGSSAAAIVAGMFAANQLINEKYSQQELIKWAVDMEGHADNIIPAVVGGLTTAMIYGNEVYYQKVSIPDKFMAVIAVPKFTLATTKSRSVLPEKVSLMDTVNNLQRACFLLASLHNGDFRYLKLAMDDMIYQPLRKQFIPGFDEVITAAYDKQALGVAMSGAGPSIIAFTDDCRAQAVGMAMENAFREKGVDCIIYNLKPDLSGVNIEKH